jgi:nicotinamidase-related amidase
MGKTALVVIDLQNAFINTRIAPLIQKIRSHIEDSEYDFVIFSKFVNSPSSNFIKKLNWNKCKSPPETDLAINPSEICKKFQVFEKSTYSIFKSEDFRNFLEKNKVTKLYFCGLDIEACVLASVFDAFDLGYDYEILLNLSASSAKEDLTECATKIIRQNFCRF